MSSTGNPDRPENRIISTEREEEVLLTEDPARRRTTSSNFGAVGTALSRSLFVRTVLALTEHTGSTAFAALCFWAAGFVIKALLHEGWVLKTVDTIEGIGLIVLVFWFFIQMFRQLYKATKEGSNGSHSILVV
jgi:hypothetical protein